MEFDPRILDYATPRQRQYVELLAKYDSERAACAALGIAPDTIGKGYYIHA